MTRRAALALALPLTSCVEVSPLDWQARAIIGSWIDPADPAVLLEIIVVSNEGRGRFLHCFGHEEQAFTWNYESFTPLRLGVFVGQRTRFLAVGFKDPEHIRARLVDTIDEAVLPKVLDHPGTRSLRRPVSPVTAPPDRSPAAGTPAASTPSSA